MPMQRGFVFSIDAAIALVLVMILGATMVFSAQAVESEADAFVSSERIATDSALVAKYLEKTPSQMGLSSSIPSSAAFGSCGVRYSYGEIQLNSSPRTPSKQSYCHVFAGA